MEMVATTVLAKVDGKRLQKAVEALVSGAYTITVTAQSEEKVSGYVVNGDGKEYGVVLTRGQTFCGCPDSMFQSMVCKHQVVLALHVIRHPRRSPRRGTGGRTLRSFTERLCSKEKGWESPNSLSPKSNADDTRRSHP